MPEHHEPSVAHDRSTNVAFVCDLMAFSKYGALAQVFIIDAIMQHAKAVSQADPALFDNPMLRGPAWVDVAQDIHHQCEARYGH
jgi:hypothetical protein